MSQKYEIIPYRQKNSTIIFEAQPILLLNLPVGENVRVSVLICFFAFAISTKKSHINIF